MENETPNTEATDPLVAPEVQEPPVSTEEPQSAPSVAPDEPPATDRPEEQHPEEQETPKRELTKQEVVLLACAKSVHEVVGAFLEADAAAPAMAHWEDSSQELKDQANSLVAQVFSGAPLEGNAAYAKETEMVVSIVVAVAKALGCPSRSPTTVDMIK